MGKSFGENNFELLAKIRKDLASSNGTDDQVSIENLSANNKDLEGTEKLSDLRDGLKVNSRKYTEESEIINTDSEMIENMIKMSMQKYGMDAKIGKIELSSLNQKSPYKHENTRDQNTDLSFLSSPFRVSPRPDD